MNYARTALLLAAMTGLFMMIGYMIGGQGGMLIAFMMAAAMNVWSYWYSDQAVLGMHGAREIGPRDDPQFYGLVQQLAARAGLPMPRVFIMDTDQPNAFATGRDPEHAAVAATTGLLRRLTQEEIAGVMAHELAHVKNRDTLIMTITATLAGAIGMLANFAFFFGGSSQGEDGDEEGGGGLGMIGTLLVMFLAPMAAALVQMAISRTREYAADRMGAEISGNPQSLASALQKIEAMARGLLNTEAERHPATAHMFIINPLNGQSMDNLFSTHPNTENRVAALQAMSGTGHRPAGGNHGQGSPRQGPWSSRRRGPWG